MEQRILRGQEQTASSYSVSRMVNGGRRLLVANSAVEAPTSFQPAPPGPGSGGLQSLNPDVVIIMVVLLFALICAAFLNSVMRCMMRRRMEAQNARAVFIGRADQDSEQGLDAKTLASLPILTFKAGESSKASKQPTALECTICLSEFTEDERLRVLPKCSHVFHLDCIDMWLLSHVSCPVCRSAIESVTSLAENGDESPDSGDVMLLVRDSTGNASVRRSAGVRITEGGVPGLSGRGLAENLDVRAELTRDRSWNSLSDAARMSSSRRLTTGSHEGSMSRNSFRAAVNSILTSSENVFSGRKSSSSVPRMSSDIVAPSLQLAGPTISSPNENTSLAANDQLRDRSSSPPPLFRSK